MLSTLVAAMLLGNVQATAVPVQFECAWYENWVPGFGCVVAAPYRYEYNLNPYLFRRHYFRRDIYIHRHGDFYRRGGFYRYGGHHGGYRYHYGGGGFHRGGGGHRR